jgi:hypothetical protein
MQATAAVGLSGQARGVLVFCLKWTFRRDGVRYGVAGALIEVGERTDGCKN